RAFHRALPPGRLRHERRLRLRVVSPPGRRLGGRVHDVPALGHAGSLLIAQSAGSPQGFVGKQGTPSPALVPPSNVHLLAEMAAQSWPVTMFASGVFSRQQAMACFGVFFFAHEALRTDCSSDVSLSSRRSSLSSPLTACLTQLLNLPGLVAD